MLTLLASHPPHPSPAQQRDSSIIHFNAKIKPAASNLSLQPFGLNTEQCAGLSVFMFVYSHCATGTKKRQKKSFPSIC